MGNITEVRVHIHAPIDDDKKVTLNAQGIVLKNAGTAVVTINSHWTMKGGETLNIGVSNDLNKIIVADFAFLFAAVGTKRIEIMEYISNEEVFKNYKRQ